MTKHFVPDPSQRVEKRRKVDHKGLKERILMEQKAQEKITFGVFTLINPPKPSDSVEHFTVAFSKPIKKSELYPKLAEALGESWDGEPTKSIFLHLDKPCPWRKTRSNIKRALEELLL